MQPDRHLTSHQAAFRHLVQGDEDSVAAHRAFYDEYLAVMDMPAELYLETVQFLFQENRLGRGRLVLAGRRIDPGAITRTALLTIEGAKDDISPPAQTVAAHRLCRNLDPSRRQELLVTGVGHYGVFSGRRWRAEIAPAIGRFIRRHEAAA